MNRSSNERGATAVEYALGIGLVVIVMLAGWSAIEDEGTDKLADRGASIGYPAEPPTGTGATSGGTAGGTTDAGSTDDTTPPYSGTVNGSCTGGADDEHTCAFSLDPPAASVVWSIEPSSPGSVDASASPTFLFKKEGTFSVRALVDGTTTVQRAVVCKELGSKSTKTLKCTVGAGT